MKKWIWITTLILTLVMMSACMEIESTPTQTPTEEVPGAFDDVMLVLEAALPSMINGDFILPTYDNHELTWSMDEQTFDQVFLY